MKAFFEKKIIPIILSISIVTITFFTYSIPVYAIDFMPTDIIAAIEYGIENNDWDPFYRFILETSDGLMYLFSQMGAVVSRDFITWVNNNEKLKSLANTVPARKEDDNITFTKEFMAQLKALLDEYAKTEQTKEENGGFYLLPTIKYTEVPAENFKTMWMYRTFQNIVLEKGLLAVKIGSIQFTDPFSDPEHPILLVADASSLNEFKANPERRLAFNFFCAYDWEYEKQTIMWFENAETQLYTSCEQAVQFNTGNIGYSSGAGINSETPSYLNYDLYSTTGERMRVFVSASAAKNYSVGKRKVYFTNNYYNYVPEDLTVSIDDLQKSVSDLQKIIDELLKRISDNSREKEIEELLRQILEELRNQQSTGGGGSGGGDVTVNVDMKETNSWLSKIFSKVSQIFDRMQEGFDDVVEQLKKIKRWAAVDTVIDGVDAIADWLDLIHDVLKDGAGSAVAALSSALEDSTDLMKQKFPFSIPWDILFFVSVLSAEPETPHFVIPFKFDYPALDLSVDYEMELDFTPLQWLSDLSRLLLSMTYAAGLMKKTSEIILANKEG